MTQHINGSSTTKIIHYCWFGGTQKSKLIQRCIKSWKKYFPDYEIIEWNEENFDVNSTLWTKQAYEKKRWAFVSDYVRFYALEKMGGIYFDTDVEVISSMDDLLFEDAFVGFEKEYATVNPGLILYSQKPHHPLFLEIMNWYQTHEFLLPNGNEWCATVCSVFTSRIEPYGFELNGKKQSIQIADRYLTVFPRDFFNPYDPLTGRKHITTNTRSIHWYNYSWKSQKESRVLKLFKKIYHRIRGLSYFT